MRRAASLLLALVLGAACAALVACGGGGGKGLIPDSRASAMQDDLDRIDAAVRGGSCTGVDDAVARLQDQINRLSEKVDADLRSRLQKGVNHLADVAPTQCLERQSTTTTPTMPTTTTPPVTTAPPTQTETIPTTTTPTTTTPSTPTTTSPSTPTTPPDDGSGGATVPGAGAGAGNGGGNADGNGNGNGNGGAPPTP